MGVIPFSVPKPAQKARDMGLIPAGTPKTARKVGDRGQKGPWSYFATCILPSVLMQISSTILRNKVLGIFWAQS